MRRIFWMLLAVAACGEPMCKRECVRARAQLSRDFSVQVDCDDSKWTKRAKDILEQTGADDVASTGEEGADFQKTDKPMRRAS